MTEAVKSKTELINYNKSRYIHIQYILWADEKLKVKRAEFFKTVAYTNYIGIFIL